MNEDQIVREPCPRCGREVSLQWDTEQDGYEIHCPYCGIIMMLCDECRHRTGELKDDCDQDQIGWCRFSKEKYPGEKEQLHRLMLNHSPRELMESTYDFAKTAIKVETGQDDMSIYFGQMMLRDEKENS